MVASVGSIATSLVVDATPLNRGLDATATKLTQFQVQASAKLLAFTRSSNSAMSAAARSSDLARKSFGLNSAQLLELNHSGRAAFDVIASGQSPMRALQLEGARLVQTLASGEGGIGGALEGIGGAALSLLTPMNVALGAVGLLTAGAIAWLVAENDHTIDATKALEAHQKWLDKILVGYDDAKKAVDGYITAASNLPEGAAKSEIEAQSKPAAQNLSTALGQVQTFINSLNTDLTQGVEQFGSKAAAQSVQDLVDVVRQAGITASSSKDQYDNLIVSLTQLKNSSDKVGPTEAVLAGRMLGLIENAKKAAAAVGSLQVAEDNLPHSVTTTINIQMKGYTEAAKKLADLMPDLRDRYTKERDDATAAYNSARGSATDEIQRQAVTAQYQAVLAGINKQEQQDTAKKGARSIESEQKRIDGVTSSLNQQLAALTETDREQAIANALSNAHVRATTEDGRAIADLAGRLYDQKQAIAQINAAWAEAKGLTVDFVDTFESDLENGDSALSALGDGVENLGNSLIKLATNAIINGFFANLQNSVSGGSSSSGGNIFSAIGHFFGFDSGGYTGSGGRLQPAGIVHKGEYVFDAASTARAGVGNLMKLHSALRGYANGGPVGVPSFGAIAGKSGSDGVVYSPTIQIDARGAQVGVAAQIKTALEQYNRDLPDRLKQIRRDPRYRG